MWSTLALLTTSIGPVPPLQLTAMAFAIAFLLACSRWLAIGSGLRRQFRWPLRVWLIGVSGLFGYHALYFLALRAAPAAEANLINYLWPLLIVLFSALLPGERLRWWHICGACLGLAGTALLISARIRTGFAAEFGLGYAAAAACAVVWAGYSVLSRRLAEVPTDSVGAFCGATAVCALVAHLAFEETAWPQGLQWLALAALGAGPVGLAFFAWDVGMKRGDIRALGAAAYLTPLLSTALLIVFGRAEAQWTLLAAAALVTGGAGLAAKSLFRRRRGAP